MKFRKKPIVIDAVQWNGKNLDEIRKFAASINGRGYMFHSTVFNTVKINTLEGIMTASIGDWIIKGIRGEFYPVKNNIFDETYERVKEK